MGKQLHLRSLILAVAMLINGHSLADTALQPSSTQSFGNLFRNDPLLGATQRRQDIVALNNFNFTAELFGRFLPVRTNSTLVKRLLDWNEISLATSGFDHFFIVKDPADPCSGTVGYEQLGPHRSSRAMAIVHLAMFEALNAVDGKFDPYTDVKPITVAAADRERVLHFAIAHAAYRTLARLYKNQTSRFLDFQLQDNLKDQGVPADGSTEKAAQDAGQALGIAAADAVLAKKKDDTANLGGIEGNPVPEPVLVADQCNPSQPFPMGTDRLSWRQDPVSRLNVAMGANWGRVKPFAMQNGDQFRLPPFPAGSIKFKEQIKELMDLGSSNSAIRTPTETMMGVFWAYDGVPSLCAPPTLYNQVVRSVLQDDKRRDDENFVARLFAVVNVALADSAIAAWDSKFTHSIARPVTYLRATETSLSDGPTCDPKTPACVMACREASDTKYCPLGAPATNGKGPNFTPPFPSYPSGHAVFGGALFQILRSEWPDATSFTLTSKEFNGENSGAGASGVRPVRPQSWASFKDAEAENARSRIWLGIHWQIDADAGVAQGRCVANFALATVLRPKGAAAPTPPACDYSSLN